MNGLINGIVGGIVNGRVDTLGTLLNPFTYLDIFSAAPVYKNDGWYFEDASGEGNDVLVKNQQVATFSSGKERLVSGYTIPGQTALTLRMIIKPTNFSGTQNLLMTALATTYNGFNIHISSVGLLQYNIRDGSGSNHYHSIATLTADTLYDISIEWNGLTGGNIKTTINGVVYDNSANASWIGESTGNVAIGHTSGAFVGQFIYFKMNESIEYVFNHGTEARVYNLLAGTLDTIYNFSLGFWDNAIDGVEPFQYTRGATLYKGRRSALIYIVCGNIPDDTFTMNNGIYDRLGYYENGIFYGCKNKYVIPVSSSFNSVLPAGEYTFMEFKALTANRIVKVSDYYSITSLKVDAGIERYSELIEISGDGTEREKFIILNLHKYKSLYDKKKQDVFFNGRCNNDFSDVRIYDASENVLPFQILSRGNYDVVPDTVSRVEMLSTGQLITNNPYTYLSLSSDDGRTWEEKPFNGQQIFATNDDTLIYYRDYKVYRSEYPYESKSEILDFTLVSGQILVNTVVQFSTGEIILGRYQQAYDVKIYKSTDDGATWTEVYATTSYQHVHNLYIDETQSPTVVYAGLDGTNPPILKSSDKGETWSEISLDNPVDYGVIHGESGFRMVGGETGIDGGYAIQKTVNDSDFTPSLEFGNGFYNIGKIGDTLFAAFVSSINSENTGILKSDDNGASWELVFITKPFSIGGASDGFRHMTDLIKPTGAAEDTIIVTPQGGYSSMRITIGNNYSALVLCRVNIPATGTTIKVESKRSNTIPELNTLIDKSFPETLVKIPFNEGTGTSLNEEISSTAITVTNPSWVDGIKRLYNFYPPIQAAKELNAMKLNADSTISPVSLNLTGGNFTLLFWSEMSEITAEEVILSFGNTTGHGLQFSNAQDIKQGETRIHLIQGNKSYWPKFYALTVDSSGNSTLYINGGGEVSVLSGENPIDLTLFTGDCYFFANHFSIAGLSNFSHPVQELQLVNRILTATEISEMYGGLIDDLYE